MNTSSQQHTTAPAMPVQPAPAGWPVPPQPAYAPTVPPAVAQPLPPRQGAGAPPRSVARTRIVLIAAAIANLVLALAVLLQAQAELDSYAAYRGAWFAGALSGQEQAAQAAVGFAQLALVWTALHAAGALALAVRLGRGRGGLHRAVVVFGAWQCLMGALTLAVGSEAGAAAVLQALATLAGGALTAWYATRPDTTAAVVVFGAWQCLMGALTLAVGSEAGAAAVLQALATLAGGALTAWYATRPDTTAWARRPRP
ncbi:MULTISPECIES: hypothetical protein [Kitasatospora]|nr:MULTISPECIES: hypothetical protein [Kitasatospora]